MAKRVLIVGAGLGGSLLALYLGRAGHKVMLVERRGDPRAKNYVGGRSINLAISARGIRAPAVLSEMRATVLADRKKYAR